MDPAQLQSSELTLRSTKRKRGVSPAKSAVAEQTNLGRGRRKKSKTQKAAEMSKINLDATAFTNNNTTNRDSTASIDTDNVHQAQDIPRNITRSRIEIRLSDYFSESPKADSKSPLTETQTTLKIKFKPSYSVNNYKATQKAREILEKRGEPVENVPKQVIKLRMKRTHGDMAENAEQSTMRTPDSHSLNPETTTAVTSVPPSASLPIRARSRTAQENRESHIDLDESGSNYSDSESVALVRSQARRVQEEETSDDELTESDSNNMELDSPAPIEPVRRPTLASPPPPRRGRGRPRRVPAAPLVARPGVVVDTVIRPPPPPRRFGEPPRVVEQKKVQFDRDLDRANWVTGSGPYSTTATKTPRGLEFNAQSNPVSHLMRYLRTTLEPLSHGTSAQASLIRKKLDEEYKWLYEPMSNFEKVMLTKYFWFDYGNGNWASRADSQRIKLREDAEETDDNTGTDNVKRKGQSEVVMGLVAVKPHASFKPNSVSGAAQNSGVWLEEQE